MADIHGNIQALQAVLDDIERRGITKIVNLGDCLYGPLEPRETADILMQLQIPTVSGNEDRIILASPSEAPSSPTLRYVRESLKPQHLAWLASLEMTATAYDYFFLCHGTPKRDDEYLLQQVTSSGVFPRKIEALTARLHHIAQPFVLCGHDHVAGVVHLPDGKIIVNPGSVGLPAYTDDKPFPHAMQAGSPHARYSIISKNENGWRVENIAIPYDWQAAARKALKNGRPDWAEWLTKNIKL